MRIGEIKEFMSGILRLGDVSQWYIISGDHPRATYSKVFGNGDVAVAKNMRVAGYIEMDLRFGLIEEEI